MEHRVRVDSRTSGANFHRLNTFFSLRIRFSSLTLKCSDDGGASFESISSLLACRKSNIPETGFGDRLGTRSPTRESCSISLSDNLPPFYYCFFFCSFTLLFFFVKPLLAREEYEC